MMSITYESIKHSVRKTLVKAGSSFRPDQIAAYERAIASEENPHAKWALEQILENARVAEERSFPLCDDSGIPHVYLEVGQQALLPADFLGAIEEGIRLGLQDLPGRPMAVLGNDCERIEQSAGLSGDPGALAMAPVQIRSMSGNRIRITILMYGGGSEIQGKTLPVFHKHSLDTVINEMIAWGKKSVGKLGCLPAVLSFGIGRSSAEASSLSLEAMAKGSFDSQDEIGRRVTEAVNRTGIGAMGLGGVNTVLATFVKVGPQRASGVRIISMRCGCCYDPRRATIVLY